MKPVTYGKVRPKTNEDVDRMMGILVHDLMNYSTEIGIKIHDQLHESLR